MSFSFSASGTGDEVISQLNTLTDAALGNDRAGVEIRDLIAAVIGETGADVLQPHQVYVIRASGHSSATAPLMLSVGVQLGDRHTPDGQ